LDIVAEAEQPGACFAGVLAGASGSGTLLVRRQLGLSAPMLTVDLYRRPMFALFSVTAMSSFAAQRAVSLGVWRSAELVLVSPNHRTFAPP
jgi:hypothetical protein